jgi:hypothetical protein
MLEVNVPQSRAFPPKPLDSLPPVTCPFCRTALTLVLEIGVAAPTQSHPAMFDPPAPMTWECPGCRTVLVTREGSPRCPRCGYFDVDD